MELSEDIKMLRSRPVGMCDGVLNLICGVSAQLITSGLMRLSHNEIFIGKSLNFKDVNFLDKEFANKDGCIYYSPD